MLNSSGTKIKGINISTPYFLAPINTGLAEQGNPTANLINFHSLRSNSYTGISYVGNVAINYGKITNKNTLFVNKDMWQYHKLTEAITNNGSVPGVQIACFYSNYKARRNWINDDVESYKKFIQNEIKNFSVKEIIKIIKSFQKGIKTLSQLGFKAIQLHAAHGYFLNNFLSKTFNERDDEFGKDRTLIIKEIINGLDSVIRNTLIDVRISLFEEKIEPKLKIEQENLINGIYSLKEIDIISISNGIYNIDKKLIYPIKSQGNEFMLPILKDYIDEKRSKIWNLCGNVRNVDPLLSLKDNVTFSIGRPLIADHDFIKKHFERKSSEITHCDFKNRCHYFSRKKECITCGVNKRVF